MVKEHWDTPFGPLLMQGESNGIGGGPRFYFAMWHRTAKPPEEYKTNKPEGFKNKKAVSQKIDRWVAEMWKKHAK